LLAHAIRTAESAYPPDMAEALRTMGTWNGVTGPHAFRDNGEIEGKPVVKKLGVGGRFTFDSE
jgi:hypothetical protein